MTCAPRTGSFCSSKIVPEITASGRKRKIRFSKIRFDPTAMAVEKPSCSSKACRANPLCSAASQYFPARRFSNAKRPSSAVIIACAVPFCGSPTATCVCDNGCPLNAFTMVPLIRKFCPAGGCPSAAVAASTIVRRKAALCALISPLSPDQARCYDFRPLARLCASLSSDICS
jgi:hypothetical protein